METPPLTALPLLPASAGGDPATDTAAALVECDFQALLAQLAGGPTGAAERIPALPAAGGEATAADDSADPAAADVVSAADSALALLAGIPPQIARTDVVAPAGTHPANPAAGGPAGTQRIDATAHALPRVASGPAPQQAPQVTGAEEAPVPGTAPTLTDPVASLSQVPEPPAVHFAHATPAAVGTAHAAPVVASPPPIDVPLGLPGWSAELGQRLMWIAGEKQQVAELHINPPHLGPVDITLTLNDDQASAVFASPHGIVRETIEAALPRLREVLAESGINLGQASVTADSPRDGSGRSQPGTPSRAGAAHPGPDTGPVASHAWRSVQRPVGLVDLFA